jgi:ankyrin repeat protein
MSLSQLHARSIVAPIETAVQQTTEYSFSGLSQVDQKRTAEAAYQLSRAYDISFGVSGSKQLVIKNLLLSCILGHIEARKEVFRIHAAYSVDFPPEHKVQLEQWLYAAALDGDKVCTDNLREVSNVSFNHFLRNRNRRRQLCERSGIIFDDDFWNVNDVNDAAALAKAIVDSGDPLDVDIGGGMTWLHVAAYGGSVELAMMLVDDMNFPLDSVNDRGQTAVWIACLGGRRDIAVFLLDRGADASLASLQGLNPLHSLPSFEDSDVKVVAEMLVTNGADVNGRGPDGITPLHFAVRGSGLSATEPAVTVLLDLGSNPLLEDDSGESALDAAIFIMRTHFVQQILDSEPIRDLNRGMLCEILAKAFEIFVGQMKWHRLSQGSSTYRERLMFLVQLFCNDDIIEKYILGHEMGNSRLHDCYLHRSLDIAHEMLHMGVPTLVNMQSTKGHGMTPLLAAVSKAISRPDLETLIAAGADILLLARTGANVLHYCVEYAPELTSWFCSLIEERVGSSGLIDFLNARTKKQGWTPLDYALVQRDGNMATYLRNRGADPAKCKHVQGDPSRWNDVLNQIHDSLSGSGNEHDEYQIIRESQS